MDWYKNFKERKFNAGPVTEYEGEDDDDEELELNPGAQHSLVRQDQMLCLAPGENNTPVSLLFDNFAELSFPRIYCGKARVFRNNLTYLQITNSEL